MSTEEKTPLIRDLLAQLDASRRYATKRPEGPVMVGRPSDEPEVEAGSPRPGGLKGPLK